MIPVELKLVITFFITMVVFFWMAFETDETTPWFKLWRMAFYGSIFGMGVSTIVGVWRHL